MINKNYPLILHRWATMMEIDGGRSNDGGSLSGWTLFLSRWQPQWQPVGEDTIHVAVLKVVDEGSRQGRRQWRLAADKSVDGGGQQQRSASSPLVFGGGKAIVGR
jgi:hypothetical protein